MPVDLDSAVGMLRRVRCAGSGFPSSTMANFLANMPCGISPWGRGTHRLSRRPFSEVTGSNPIMLENQLRRIPSLPGPTLDLARVLAKWSDFGFTDSESVVESSESFESADSVSYDVVSWETSSTRSPTYRPPVPYFASHCISWNSRGDRRRTARVPPSLVEANRVFSIIQGLLVLMRPASTEEASDPAESDKRTGYRSGWLVRHRTRVSVGMILGVMVVMWGTCGNRRSAFRVSVLARAAFSTRAKLTYMSTHMVVSPSLERSAHIFSMVAINLDELIQNATRKIQILVSNMVS